VGAYGFTSVRVQLSPPPHFRKAQGIGSRRTCKNIGSNHIFGKRKFFIINNFLKSFINL
jgi:hypothetical protein